MTFDHDLILVGGGLANGLIALQLRRERPAVRLLLLEADGQVGGNHTWSFHGGDLTACQHLAIAPLIAHRWDHYDVRFPGYERRIRGGYASLTSASFRRELRAGLGESIRTGVRVRAVAPTAVELADGTRLSAAAVIDGRGLAQGPGGGHVALAHQRFLGQELALDAPHGLQGPLLMDSTVEQHEGYRFVYVLPLGPRRLLVEDTYYADDAVLDADSLRIRIAAYVRARGWRTARVLREEHGVLPITLAGDAEAFWDEAGEMPRAGLAAGLCHPTTGYSLPEAARLAERIAALSDLSAAPLAAAIRAHALAAWRRHAFFRGLNRMLFLAGEPAKRWQVMDRFYRLPEPLIRRFYAGQLKWSDKLRLLAGKPPVPVGQALRALGRYRLHIVERKEGE